MTMLKKMQKAITFLGDNGFVIERNDNKVILTFDIGGKKSKSTVKKLSREIDREGRKLENDLFGKYKNE